MKIERRYYHRGVENLIEVSLSDYVRDRLEHTSSHNEGVVEALREELRQTQEFLSFLTTKLVEAKVIDVVEVFKELPTDYHNEFVITP